MLGGFVKANTPASAADEALTLEDMNRLGAAVLALSPTVH